MTKPHLGTEDDQTVRLSRRQSIDGHSQLCCRAEEQPGIADGLGRGDEQQQLRLLGQSLNPAHKPLLDSRRRGALPRNPEATRQFSGRDTSRYLENCQRQAARLGDDPVTHARIHATHHHRFEQFPRVGVGQAADGQFRQSLQQRGTVTDGEDQRDRLSQQASGHEPQRLDRHLVEPLGIVDDAHHRSDCGGRGQQAQYCQTHQESVRHRPDRSAERHVQGTALRFRQGAEVPGQRRAQLLQAGVGEFHVGLDACDLHDVMLSSALDEMVEQGGFSCAGLTTQHQHLGATR